MVAFDWSYHAEDLQRLVEVFQACRGNYEDDGCFRQYSDGTSAGTFVADGLRQEHRFGLISSSDHGNGASYVGAFAEELSRQSVFAALHGRRTIAATTRDILVDFRLNGSFMGEEAAPSATAEITVTARGYCDVARVDVIRNGAVAHSLEPDLDLGEGEIAVPMRVEWSTGRQFRSDWSGWLEIDGGEVLATKFWSPEIVEVTAAPRRLVGRDAQLRLAVRRPARRRRADPHRSATGRGTCQHAFARRIDLARRARLFRGGRDRPGRRRLALPPPGHRGIAQPRHERGGHRLHR